MVHEGDIEKWVNGPVENAVTWVNGRVDNGVTWVNG